MINVTFKKAAGDKIIVENGRALPEVYDSLTDAVFNIFYPEIKRRFVGNELEIVADLTFNPPKAANS